MDMSGMVEQWGWHEREFGLMFTKNILSQQEMEWVKMV